MSAWVHDGLARARLHRRVREREYAGVEATTAGQGGGGATANGEKQERISKNGCVHVVVGSGTCKVYPSAE
jgi:hypothetical protein